MYPCKLQAFSLERFNMRINLFTYSLLLQNIIWRPAATSAQDALILSSHDQAHLIFFHISTRYWTQCRWANQGITWFASQTVCSIIYVLIVLFSHTKSYAEQLIYFKDTWFSEFHLAWRATCYFLLALGPIFLPRFPSHFHQASDKICVLLPFFSPIFSPFHLSDDLKLIFSFCPHLGWKFSRVAIYTLHAFLCRCESCVHLKVFLKCISEARATDHFDLSKRCAFFLPLFAISCLFNLTSLVDKLVFRCAYLRLLRSYLSWLIVAQHPFFLIFYCW